jgi:hypothetical protein
MHHACCVAYACCTPRAALPDTPGRVAQAAHETLSDGVKASCYLRRCV